jgi:hypothetical protein
MFNMKVLLALTGMVVLFAFSAGVGFAGEVNKPHGYIAGNNDAQLHGNSPCSYSGLNDNYVLGLLKTDENGNLIPDGDGFTNVQNWGHLKQVTGLTGGANDVPAAGWGCNGNEFGTH